MSLTHPIRPIIRVLVPTPLIPSLILTSRTHNVPFWDKLSMDMGCSSDEMTNGEPERSRVGVATGSTPRAGPPGPAAGGQGSAVAHRAHRTRQRNSGTGLPVGITLTAHRATSTPQGPFGRT